jgi:diguanylate cyclase (GGDEF)-like protein
VDLEESSFGVLEVIRGLEDEPFLPADLKALQTVSQQLALCLRNGALHQRLNELAITDGLTGLYNYRYFQERLQMEVERANRYSRPVSLLMLDLDHFKRYNDLYGHPQGDSALRVTAVTLKSAVRRIDVAARYGGDEFAIIMPETGESQAMAAARRISAAIAEQEIPAPPGLEAERLTPSIGISCFPSIAHTREELIGQADEALYRAKRSRGRTIQLWQPSGRRSQPPVDLQ